MPIVQVPVPYHSQETGTFCGPAAAKMVLEGATGASLVQQDLYDDRCHEPGTGWATSPTGLAATLRQRGPAELQSTYDVTTYDTEPVLSRAICQAITLRQSAPVVLTMGLAHWVVVTGCDLDLIPDSPGDPFTISTLFLNDPYGSQSPTFAGIFQHQAVSYADWKRVYQPYPVPGWEVNPAYRRKHIAIGTHGIARSGSEWEPELGDAPLPPPFTPAAMQGRVQQPTRQTPEEAVGNANRALYDQPFMELESWNLARIGVEPLSPVLVQTGRTPDDAYYLVPFVRRDQQLERGVATPVMVMIGAEAGEFRGMLATPEGSTFLGEQPDLLDPVAILRRFPEGFTHPKTGEQLVPTPENIAPDLYWRPCAESLSPYRPFYRVIFPKQRITVYIRLDGEVFFSLNTRIAGY